MNVKFYAAIITGLLAIGGVYYAQANFQASQGPVTIFGIDAINQGTVNCGVTAPTLVECPASVPIDATGKPLFSASNPGSVGVVGALPTGSNTVGNVGVVGALPAGSNNLGSVDIAGSLPAGSNDIGDVGIAGSLPGFATPPAVAQYGAWNFGLTGTLPAFSAPPPVAQSGPWSITPLGVTSNPTTASPTPGMFASVLAANSSRKACLIQNTSSSVAYFYPGATGSATTANSFAVNPNGTFGCNSGGTVLTDNIAATCASGPCNLVVNSN